MLGTTIRLGKLSSSSGFGQSDGTSTATIRYRGMLSLWIILSTRENCRKGQGSSCGCVILQSFESFYLIYGLISDRFENPLLKH